MQNNIQRHLTLIYGMNSNGMKSCSKTYKKFKINLKRYKTDEFKMETKWVGPGYANKN